MAKRVVKADSPSDWSEPRWFEVTLRLALQARGAPPIADEAERLAAHWLNEGIGLAMSDAGRALKTIALCRQGRVAKAIKT